MRKAVPRVCFGLALLVGAAAVAQEMENGGEEVSPLPCSGGCAASTPAEAIDPKTLVPQYCLIQTSL